MKNKFLALSFNLNFLVFPLIAFISGRILALASVFRKRLAFARPKRTLCLQRIFQNRFAFTSFFRNFALIRARTYSVSAKKEQILLFCSRLFVTLEEITGFLCIQAIREIEDFEGYG